MQIADDAPALGDGFARHRNAVRAHIGDEADRIAADLGALIQVLRDPHRARGREAELARGFLLQRRGDERRPGMPLDRFLLDLADREAARVDRIDGLLGRALLADRQLFELLAVQPDEPGGEISRCRAEIGFDRPVFLRLERFDLELALADEAERHRLHAACRARAGQLAPQHRRQREADEIIERTASEIGVDQLLVDLAGMRHRVQHGRLGYRVENDALDLGLAEGLALPQRLQHVPGNRLAFAVRVGCENQPVGRFDGIGDVLQPLLGACIHLPDHLEVVIGVDRPVLGRQVADMTIARQDLEIPAQILVDRLRLGGRLDNNNAFRFGHRSGG